MIENAGHVGKGGTPETAKFINGSAGYGRAYVNGEYVYDFGNTEVPYSEPFSITFEPYPQICGLTNKTGLPLKIGGNDVKVGEVAFVYDDGDIELSDSYILATEDIPFNGESMVDKIASGPILFVYYGDTLILHGSGFALFDNYGITVNGAAITIATQGSDSTINITLTVIYSVE